MQYIKIRDAILEQIEQGLLPPGRKLPSERKLAEHFNTTRVTLREALSLLESEAIIFREDRRGWFISPAKFVYKLTPNADFYSQCEIQSKVGEAELVSSKKILADKRSTSLLSLAPFSEVIHLKWCRKIDDRRAAFVETYLVADVFSGHQALFAEGKEPVDLIYTHVGKYSTSQITGGALSQDEAGYLNITSGAPTIKLTRDLVDENNNKIAVEIAQWRHDIVALSIETS